MGAHAWPVAQHAEHVLDVFSHDRDRLVMLTPDAAQPLEGPLGLRGEVYVIGGIVDRSVIKGLSLSWADAARVRTARLPVREHAAQLGMDFDGANKTPVLSISDVCVALLEANRNGGDWAPALAAAIPARVRRAGAAGAPSRRRRR